MSDSKPETGAELLAFMDKCAATFNEYESEKIQDPDDAKVIQDMRRLKRSSLDSLHAFQAFIEIMNIRIKQFDDHISRRALNYGLSLIPDDALLEIFTLAAESLEEKVALSLVCRRFRRVMMSTRKMWNRHCLVTRQTPEQMVAIAEGNRFISLKAIISTRGRVYSSGNLDWTRKHGFDPELFVDRFYQRSLDFILPLHLDELQIRDLREDEAEVQRIIDSMAMQSVRTLMVRNCRNTVLRSFERQHTPSLQKLDIDFVPGLTAGRDLIRCKLSDIKYHELDSLRKFLASANALQCLLLHISWVRRFYEAFNLPSLRSLAVNFTPHLSYSKHLTRFTLSWPLSLTLAELLDFLSSTEVLQALSVYCNRVIDDGGTPDAISVNSLRVATLPFLTSCNIHQGCFHVGIPLLVNTLTAKLRMPILRRMELRFRSGFVGFDEVLKVFDDFPPESFIVPLGRLIRFEECSTLALNFVNTLLGYFTDIEGVQIEFYDCKGWKDGTFRMDEIDSAWLSRT